MKKFTHYTCSLILLTFIICVGGCKKDGCTDPTAINYNSKANVDNGTCNYQGSAVFYVSSNGPAITVTLTNPNGSVVTNPTATISQGTIYDSTTVTCGASGCANYTMLPIGNYSYKASSALFNWTGTLVVGANQCSTVQLQQSTTPLTFWTPSSSFGIITVTVTGYSPATITSASSSGGPTGCSAPGCANFLLPTSNSAYSYTATGQNGGSWSGTISLSVQDQCNLVELQ